MIKSMNNNNSSGALFSEQCSPQNKKMKTTTTCKSWSILDYIQASDLTGLSDCKMARSPATELPQINSRDQTGLSRHHHTTTTTTRKTKCTVCGGRLLIRAVCDSVCHHCKKNHLLIGGGQELQVKL